MERYDFRTQRLFIDSPIKIGILIELDRTQANYLLNVLRLKDNAKVLIFNGVDGEWLCELSQQGRKSASLRIEKQIRKQGEPSKLIYLFAPLKQARLDYMVQKAVEMGVGTLQPVLTQHTQVSRINVDRMHANAIEAAEQCGILSIPRCKEAAKLEKILSNWDQNIQIIFCDELADVENSGKKLQKLNGESIAVLIGPEGGFSQKERDQLLALPFVTAISLGPRILRADTAAVAALALVQANCGDW